MKEHGWRRAGLVLALAGMILGCGGNSFAEDQRDPEAANIVASLQRDLKLNYAQVREITPVIADQIAQIRVLKTEGLTSEDMDRRLKDLRDDLDSKLENYFTPDQYSQWKTLSRSATSVQDNRRIGLARDGSLPEQGGSRPAGKNSGAAADGVLESGRPGSPTGSGVW